MIVIHVTKEHRELILLATNESAEQLLVGRFTLYC